MPLRELVHLGRCAAFGFTLPELKRAEAVGYRATVDALLDAVPEPLQEPPTNVIPPGFVGAVGQLVSLVAWWLQRMTATTAPLHERMTLFWHGYFTSSAEIVLSSRFMLNQHKLLRAHALGPFPDLLREVAVDPAMLLYLDGQSNQKLHPNENFAREVMELFTLGVGHYSEKDVREAARALTGWKVNWLAGEARFHPERFDDGPKRVLGKVIETGPELLSMLAHHPQTGQHLARRLFRFLAGVEPTRGERERLAGVYRRCHGHVRPVLRELLLGAEFRALAGRPGAVRCPLEWLVWVLRSSQMTFRQGFAGRDREPDWRHFELVKQLGQMPFFPPSVRGWPESSLWMNSATLADRFRFAAWASKRARLDGLPVARLAEAVGLGEPSPALQRELRGLTDPHEALSLIFSSPEAQLR